MKKIAVIGAGAWGSALAIHLANNGNDVTIYSHEDDVISELQRKRKNSRYFPNHLFPKQLAAKSIKDFDPSIDYLLNVVPTQYVRDFYTNNIDLKNISVINCSKGIEIKSLKTLSSVFIDELSVDPHNYAVLTGPSHAEEVVEKKPTTVVCASYDLDNANSIQKIFSNNHFRAYTSNDIRACEIGGALKNVIAIASGIVDGLNMGDNTKAALMTRGLAEITRLGVAYGADENSFAGLSGLGDLIVTCYSGFSRNRKVGELLAKGISLSEINDTYEFVAEGVPTSKAVIALAATVNVEMPISNEINEILFNNKSPYDAVKDLMTRSFTSE